MSYRKDLFPWTPARSALMPLGKEAKDLICTGERCGVLTHTIAGRERVPCDIFVK